jgi:hypothetical protein
VGANICPALLPPPNWRSGPDGGLGSKSPGEIQEVHEKKRWKTFSKVSCLILVVSSYLVLIKKEISLFLRLEDRYFPVIRKYGVSIYSIFQVNPAGNLQTNTKSISSGTSRHFFVSSCPARPACPASALTCCARCTNPNYEGEVPTSRPTRALCLCFPGRITVPPLPPRNGSCRDFSSRHSSVG